MPSLPVLSGLLLVLTMGILVVGLAVSGPKPWVKRLTLLVLLLGLLTFSLLEGFGTGLRFFGIALAGGLIGGCVGFLGWSMPRVRGMTPADPSGCPRHAMTQMNKWSEELTALGFSFAGDYVWFKPRDRVNVHFNRIMIDPERKLRFELQATKENKGLGRLLCSTGVDGHWFTTADQLDDAELFRDPLHSGAHLTRGASCRELWDAHQQHLAQAGTAIVPVGESPAEESDFQYAAWVDRLVAAGEVRLAGDQVTMPRLGIPGKLLRSYAQWLN